MFMPVTTFPAMTLRAYLPARLPSAVARAVDSADTAAPIAPEATVVSAQADPFHRFTALPLPVSIQRSPVAEAVGEAGISVRRIAVREIPRSGKPEELVERYGISAEKMAASLKAWLR